MIAQYLALSPNEKRELLSQTAARMGVDPVIVEKDFWVSAILGVLFTHPDTKDRFVFKGGTSLSKVYGAIQRFSEDIDLIVDWRLLGLGGSDRPTCQHR
jgi:predicted nucleotidyltransferase component of viral defense system